MQKYLCLFLLITVSSFSFGQEYLSLEEAVSIALQRNTTLQRAENTLSTYESGLTSSYGNLLPYVSASGSFNWSKAEDQGGTIYFAGLAIPVGSRVTEDRSYSAGIQSTWVLFDGLANFAAVARSRNELESYRYYIERVKQDLTFQTIDLYYDVMNAEQLVKFREEDVAWNQKNFETVSERNRPGAVTLADVYAQQVRLGNAELELIRARNSLETAKSNLLYYLGLDVFTVYSFTDTVKQKDFEDIEKELRTDYYDLRELVDKAMENRYDYRSAQLVLESAENSITIARSGHLPRLTNNVGYNLRANRFNNLTDSRSLYAGFTLSIPIFSGFDVYNQVQIARVNVENRKVELDDLRRSIRQTIQKNYLDVQAAEKALEVSRRNVNAAEENRRIEQEKYALGSGTILNVLIANSEYQNAQTSYINAQFDYLTLSEQLKYLVGTLDYKKYK
jgi:outer membrane protein